MRLENSKVLIFTETIAGEGHHTAAMVLASMLHEMSPQIRTSVVYGLPYVSKWLAKSSQYLYLGTISHAPYVWGWAYKRESFWSKLFKDDMAQIVAARLEPYLLKEKPDVVVTTHAMCFGGLGELRKRNTIPFRLGAVITDFDVNEFWYHPAVDFYIVATDSLKQKMISRFNIDPEKIYPTGIPIDPRFSLFPEEHNKQDAKKMLNIDPERFTVLLAGGGTGYGPYLHIIENLLSLQEPLQILAITGKNQLLYDKIKQKIEVPPQQKLNLYGYVTNMHQFMNGADVLVGKPGGLTTSEALASSLPLILYKPIPGQEERNARYLLQENVAQLAQNIDDLLSMVKNMIHCHDGQHLMKEKAGELGKPFAAQKAASIISRHIEAANKQLV